MQFQAPFTFASGVPLGVWRCAGLRLRALRGFEVFSASGPTATSAGSFSFGSVWPVLARLFQPIGSNPSVKPIRLRRPAYLVR
ncbi:DUF1010 domain-containing protein [Ottowia flava]|uniref:DUF1010 domain-containing protein n=1 Tax=Ottowia flava TaxID=2675430 RepID=A0ABW4KV46_9BURK